jgi:hypothetical protein
MKQFILIISLMLFVITAAAADDIIPRGSGERKQLFLIAGGGYASSYPEGPTAELGVEVRLMGNIHARILVDHYFGNNTWKNSTSVNHMYGISLYGVYKTKVSETVDFRLKLGGHYSRANARITALGITFTTSMADIGLAGGGGFSLQLSNTLYVYAEASIKYLMLDDPWTWVNGQMGLMFRLR